MGFGVIFKKTWEEYKRNFKAIFKLMIVFVAIPSLILMIFNNWWTIQSGLAEQSIKLINGAGLLSGNVSSADLSSSSAVLQNMITNGTPFYFVFLALTIIFAFISYFAYVSLSVASLKKEKYRFSDMVLSGKKWYWKSLGFTIVSIIFIGLLFLALIIPGIIFSVFWIFGYFVFLNEGKGIIGSLKGSYRLVKGKWWATLGYLLLVALIMVGIVIVFSIPSIIMQVIYMISIFTGNVSLGLMISSNIVKEVLDIAAGFVTTPLMILFIKNFYLSVKKK